MITSNQLTPGVTLSLEGEIYRVETAVKVSPPKGNPFIKTLLKSLRTDEALEKNFKIGQSLQDVALVERKLEYLYLEGKDYLFLDVSNLEQVVVSASIVGERIHYLKEGVDVRALLYGTSVFSIELPQFLELMVVKVEAGKASAPGGAALRLAVLETGAKVEVPPFVEVGDILKVDTTTNEYIQRV